jgi:hypothetical protein
MALRQEGQHLISVMSDIVAHIVGVEFLGCRKFFSHDFCCWGANEERELHLEV